MEQWFEIFTLLTGILYIILEIRQRNFMWVVGVLTSLAAMWVFFHQALYASFALNCYYLAVSFIGLYQWRRDSSSGKSSDGGVQVHLRTLTVRVAAVSLAAGAVLTFALGKLASLLGDPMSFLDVAVAVLSAIATWWLARSYKEQWLLWIIADGLSTALCLNQKMWWMSALYLAYTVSAFYGFWYWKKHGYSIS